MDVKAERMAMKKMIHKRGFFARTAGIIAAVGATLFLGGAMVGCGAPQPPEEGSCHAWREWVPPEQNEEGEWQSGYCRDTRTPPKN